jgi:hypothetical protein
MQRGMNNIETRHLFTMTMKSDRQVFGRTPLGERRVTIVTEATIDGPGLRATLLPGGSDWITETSDGTVLLDCRLVFQTDDGALIGMTYRGIRHGPPEVMAQMARGETVDPGLYYHRVAIFFETSAPKYAALNKMVGVGRARPEASGGVYEVFEVL